jgi:hypothetical protein
MGLLYLSLDKCVKYQSWNSLECVPTPKWILISQSIDLSESIYHCQLIITSLKSYTLFIITSLLNIHTLTSLSKLLGRPTPLILNLLRSALCSICSILGFPYSFLNLLDCTPSPPDFLKLGGLGSWGQRVVCRAIGGSLGMKESASAIGIGPEEVA